jgi:hypothetical protein
MGTSRGARNFYTVVPARMSALNRCNKQLGEKTGAPFFGLSSPLEFYIQATIKKGNYDIENFFR